jgi:hypothetical protein
MNHADIVCCKSMIAVIVINQLSHCAELFLQLSSVHFALAGDAEKITKNPTA